MALETLHRIVKYNYFKGKTVRRLDEAIYLICLFLKDREYDWERSYQKGKITKKHTAIFQNHQKALEMSSNYAIDQEGENSFKVTNQQTNAIYTVKIDEVCASHELCLLSCRYCNICLERISCNCIMNSIYFEFCKHCHFVMMNKVNNGNSSLIEYSPAPTDLLSNNDPDNICDEMITDDNQSNCFNIQNEIQLKDVEAAHQHHMKMFEQAYKSLHETLQKEPISQVLKATNTLFKRAKKFNLKIVLILKVNHQN
jgi:hypothetical protein